MSDPHRDCPLCGAATELVYRDRGDSWLEEVYVCDGEDSHQVTVQLGEPVIDEVRDASTGDVLPREEWEGRV